MARGQDLLSGHLNFQGTEVDPGARFAYWGAFANRLLRNYTRKYMFKFSRIEKRRRVIVMRGNMARRTFLRVNLRMF